jgi:hypothetical protein
LGKIVCKTGYDPAEDVNGGFQELFKLNWKSQTRFVIHFADCPCHGITFHTLGE